MERRYKEYCKKEKQARAVFSEGKKRSIAHKQGWRCPCCDKPLTAEWELDHIVPLFRFGSNDESNLQVLSAGCHAKKTRDERIEFFEIERKHKFDKGYEPFVPAENFYYKSKRKKVERKSPYFPPSVMSLAISSLDRFRRRRHGHGRKKTRES